MPVKPNPKRREKAQKRVVGRPMGVEGEILEVTAGAMLSSAMSVEKGGVWFQPIDEIIMRKGWGTYRDMRHDDQVKACLEFKKVLVVGRQFEMVCACDGEIKKIKAAEKKAEDDAKRQEELDAVAKGAAADAAAAGQTPPTKMAEPPVEPEEDDDPEDMMDAPEDMMEHTPEEIELSKEIAEFVEWNLERINAKKKLRSALSAFDFGFSAGEIIWEPAEWKGQRVIAIKDIKHRDPQSIEIKQDIHGEILGFRQQSMSELITIDRNKIWHFAHQSEFGNAYGISDLRAAYRSWWAKKFVINFWNVFLERMGSPMTMMRYPQGASSDLKNTLKAILRGLASKTEILVPAGVEVELVEAQRAGTATYDGALDFHNASIARALLMVGVIGAGMNRTSAAGDSQSRLHLRILFKMADQIADDLRHSFMSQVIKPLVDMNFEHKDLYPEMVWQDYGEFEGMEIADTIADLHKAGVVTLDQTDINYVRSIVGLQLRNEDDNPDEPKSAAEGGLPPPGGTGLAPPGKKPGGANPPPAAPSGNDRAKKSKGGRRVTEPNSTVRRK